MAEIFQGKIINDSDVSLPKEKDYYYNSINYGSIFLELIVSIIQILLLIIISKIIFGLVTRKKRDLL